MNILFVECSGQSIDLELGSFSMSKFEYNESYYTNLLHMYAGTASLIAGVRWDFVKEVDAKRILDYGCGLNFMTIFAPAGTDIDSYDIGHIGNYPYPQTGIRWDRYDLIFFHDVLEHVDWTNEPDVRMEEMFQKTQWISVTVPILPDDVPLKKWKHYKPGEHLTYFSEKSLDEFFWERGFEKVKSGYPECPPRRDILSVLYKEKGETSSDESTELEVKLSWNGEK
jgi:hypothetical protein